MAAVCAGSLLVPPHVYGYDAGLLLLSIWLAIFMSARKWTRIAALLICTPIPFLMNLAGTPWSAATPVTLLFFLLSLNRKSEARVPNVSREVACLAESHPLV